MQTRAHCTFGRRKSRSNLVQTEVQIVVEGDDVTVARGQLLEGLPDSSIALAGCSRRRDLGVVRSVVRRWQISEVFEIEPAHHARAVPPLRPHEHESLI